jgi:hypothetical protein
MSKESTTGYVELTGSTEKQTPVGLDKLLFNSMSDGLGEEIQPEKAKRHFFSWLQNTVTIYDGRTICLVALQFFSEGAMFMITLAATVTFSTMFWI